MSYTTNNYMSSFGSILLSVNGVVNSEQWKSLRAHSEVRASFVCLLESKHNSMCPYGIMGRKPGLLHAPSDPADASKSQSRIAGGLENLKGAGFVLCTEAAELSVHFSELNYWELQLQASCLHHLSWQCHQGVCPRTCHNLPLSHTQKDIHTG